MKRSILVVLLALALVLIFASSAFATTGKFFLYGTSYYSWGPKNAQTAGSTVTTSATIKYVGGVSTVPGADGSTGPGSLSNTDPAFAGAHGNYIATTAKCGMCHSVHRASGTGVKLLPTADTSCAGCHTGGTAITTKIITWASYNAAWVPETVPGEPTVVTTDSITAAGAYGGPHNDSAYDLYADEYKALEDFPVPPSYTIGERYGCYTRRCHASNPHGVGGSKYAIMKAKFLFNNSAVNDNIDDPAIPNTFGGDDAVWDNMGATDAAVERFALANASYVQTGTDGLIRIRKAVGESFRLPNAAETHTLVAGLTCGRPSNNSGHDECHAEASYAIFAGGSTAADGDNLIQEDRNHATGLTQVGSLKGEYRTDNAGDELPNYGGNDNRDSKTGHVAGDFSAQNAHGSYAAIAGCTSCHDQTDADNTVDGHFTFPHGQTPTGITNAYANAASSTTAVGLRSRIWSGWAADLLGKKIITSQSYMKAYDGQCLKCHRDGYGSGIGQTM